MRGGALPVVRPGGRFRLDGCLLGMIAGMIVDWPRLALLGPICGSGDLASIAFLHFMLLPSAHIGMATGAIVDLVRRRTGGHDDARLLGWFGVRLALGYLAMVAGGWSVARHGGAMLDPALREAIGMIAGMTVADRTIGWLSSRRRGVLA